MKHTLCLLLALLLLCGCTPTPEPGSAPSASAHPAPAATGAAPVGPEALEAGTVLFYRQADFEARQGVLLPLTLVRSAPEEALLPRTHLYDDMFPGDAKRPFLLPPEAGETMSASARVVPFSMITATSLHSLCNQL